MTKTKFVLSSISRGLLFRSVNHTSIYQNSELNIFKGMKFFGASFNKLLNGLLEKGVYKIL